MKSRSAQITRGLLALTLLISNWNVVQALTIETPNFTVDQTTYWGQFANYPEAEQFLGIPFAKPPIGELRWQAANYQAVRNAGVETELSATEFAPACMQGPHITNWYRGLITSFEGDPNTFPEPQVNEDCLYLYLDGLKLIDKRRLQDSHTHEPVRYKGVCLVHGLK